MYYMVGKENVPQTTQLVALKDDNSLKDHQSTMVPTLLMVYLICSKFDMHVCSDSEASKVTMTSWCILGVVDTGIPPLPEER